MERVIVMGIDLAKRVFQLHGVDRNGRVVVRKKVTRSQLIGAVLLHQPELIGMEACGGAHHWGRELINLGLDVRLMAPQFVKAYRKNSKNDFNDAEAICEAVARPNMRFVPIKGLAQQDIQSLHRIRNRLITNRTALINEIQGLSLEYGEALPSGNRMRQELVRAMESENKMTASIKQCLSRMLEELSKADEEVEFYEKKIMDIYKNTEACRRLGKVEGVGPLTATAVFASLSNPNLFSNGREYAASLGLVPNQNSSGAREQLLSITKRGDRHLRSLLVHGARSYLRTCQNKTDSKSLWAIEKQKTRGHNKACVAIANKHARILWALMRTGEDYKQAV